MNGHNLGVGTVQVKMGTELMQGDQLRSCSCRGDAPKVEAHSKGKREAESLLEDCNTGLQKNTGFKIQHVITLLKKRRNKDMEEM